MTETTHKNGSISNVEKEKNGRTDKGPESENGLGQEEEVETRCGFGRCLPSWLQICNNPKVFLFWLCWFSLNQGFVVNGVNNVNTSTIERRFGLGSRSVSLISSFYDIAAGLLVVPATYFGTYAHQPRMLAVAAAIMSVGSFIMTLPHFTTDLYELGNTIGDKCIHNSTVQCGPGEANDLENYLYVFLLGQFLHGIGGCILYSIGVVFLDSMVSTKASPMYSGIMYTFSALGPALGYLLGGQLLNIYVDADVLDPDSIDVEPNDPRWVGAWWIGFLSGAILNIPVFVGLLPYPKVLPSAAKANANKKSQAHNNGAEDVAGKEGFGSSIKDFPLSVKLLIKNPVNMFVTFAGITEGIVTAGFATFMPKFIENQFSQTSGMAAMLGGGMAVPGAAGGQFLGGLITGCMKLKVKGMLKLCIICNICCILACAAFFAKCSDELIAGVSVSYGNMGGEIKVANLTANCNADCGCSSLSYEPVCGINNIQYFTPCHAGCYDSNVTADGTTVYYNCSCITPPIGSTFDFEAQVGKCASSCSLVWVFLPFLFLVTLFTFMTSVPGLAISLRCVPDNQRSFALGLKWVFIRFLGTVPGPILFGAIFDAACSLWQEECGERGSCWIYDNSKLGLNVFLFALAVKILSGVFFCLAHFFYKAPPDEEDDKTATMTTTASTLDNSDNFDKGPNIDQEISVISQNGKENRSFSQTSAL